MIQTTEWLILHFISIFFKKSTFDLNHWFFKIIINQSTLASCNSKIPFSDTYFLARSTTYFNTPNFSYLIPGPGLQLSEFVFTLEIDWVASSFLPSHFRSNIFRLFCSLVLVLGNVFWSGCRLPRHVWKFFS